MSLRRTGRRRLRRLLVFVFVAMFGLAVSGYPAAGYFLYDEVSRTDTDVACRTSDVTPDHLVFQKDGTKSDFSRLERADYQDVRFPSRTRGIEIAAWYMPAAPNAPAVVVTHGLHACRHDPAALVPAAMLRADGFSVLAIDLRDHGDSTREDGRYAGGIEERADVLGARDWLVAQGVPVDRIGSFGTSMGAGATLIAAAVGHDFAAVWEDSSYADTQTRISEQLAQLGYPTLLAPIAPLMASLVAGDDISSWSPLTAIRAMSGTALYIAHGANDQATFVHHADDLYAAAEAAGLDVEMWVAPHAGHTAAYRMLPDEYERRLDGFFERH